MGFLRWQRGTLELKCAGLETSELAERPIAPSALSLLGLVRHMADVERFWFRQVLAGEPAEPHYWSDEDPDADFSVFERVMIDEAQVAFRRGWERDQRRSVPRAARRQNHDAECRDVHGDGYRNALDGRDDCRALPARARGCR